MKITLYILSVIVSGYIYYRHAMNKDVRMNLIGSLFLIVNMFIPLSNLMIAGLCVRDDKNE